MVHTNMVFNEREIAFGNYFIFTANRLQYLSNTEKLNTVTQLFDRGFLTHNQGLEIFNMSPVENGDKRFIRREYIETNDLGDEENIKDEIVEEEGGGNENADQAGQTVQDAAAVGDAGGGESEQTN